MDPGTDNPPGGFDFTHAVDDVVQDEDYVVRRVDRSWDPGFLLRSWVYNFPDGMTGTHTFTGHWWAPCQWAVDHDHASGSCSIRNATVEMYSGSVTVDVVP